MILSHSVIIFAQDFVALRAHGEVFPLPGAGRPVPPGVKDAEPRQEEGPDFCTRIIAYMYNHIHVCVRQRPFV